LRGVTHPHNTVTSKGKANEVIIESVPMTSVETISYVIGERASVAEGARAIVKLLHASPVDHVEVQSKFLDVFSHLANLVSLAGNSSQRDAISGLASLTNLALSAHAYDALEMLCSIMTAIPVDLTKRPVRVEFDFGALGTRLEGAFERK
jgi:hypothetical protein